ncbi:methionyl-tRNA formyltransferase [Mycoplasmoides alvi]|uniref:methionyl-tRNA formyltransferase n=1 Tax=Mycoplasmoides alvi TaxID=78580 RepID=UPI00051AD410|nr:methionyl-tRNA formyltransferase [Mycoplasmoides alvi]
MKTKVIFFGSTNLSAACLSQILSDKNFDVCCVVCQPDNPKAKKNNKWNEIKQTALKYNIKCLQPLKIVEIFEEIKSLKAEIGICVAYGQFIPESIINLFHYGIINVHPSLLPKYRGGAPIQHAIMNGDLETGITIMKLTKEMDAGDYCFQNNFSINSEWTSGELMNKVIKDAPKILLLCMYKILSNDITWHHQDSTQKSLAPIFTREQEKINWNFEAFKIVRHIKAFSPAPGTFSFFDKNKTIKFFNATLGNHEFDTEPGIINLLDKNFICIQAINKKCVHITEFLLPGKKRIEVRKYNGVYPFNLKDKLF